MLTAVVNIAYVVAEKHGGQTVEDNLALACKICNFLCVVGDRIQISLAAVLTESTDKKGFFTENDFSI